MFRMRRTREAVGFQVASLERKFPGRIQGGNSGRLAQVSATAKLAVLPASQSNGQIEPGDILTPGKLAERLHRKVSWVYKHTEQGCRNPLPVLRCDGFLLFCWPDVCAW